jgi:ABC-type uncharacterized transport system involved in gliding motility auxiliary subunit
MTKHYHNTPFDIMKANLMKDFGVADLTMKKSISLSITLYNINRFKKKKMREQTQKAIDNYLANGGKITVIPPRGSE